MTISKQKVEHLAHLAKLDLTEEQAEEFSGQISDILNYVNQLKKIDTENIKPTNNVTRMTNIFREDIIENYPDELKIKLLNQVPVLKNNYIVVPHSIKKFQTKK
jgi:aspartyl-tRNA(Asn)/glutamyl-tRNA(Gln) amidotransferase subunit C